MAPGWFWACACGASGVKAERPEAEPRTNGLEAGAVRAMLFVPGEAGVVVGGLLQVPECSAGVGRAESSAAGHPFAIGMECCDRDRSGVNQSGEHAGDHRGSD